MNIYDEVELYPSVFSSLFSLQAEAIEKVLEAHSRGS